jgi:folate-binding protein YgfZ
MIIGAMNTTTHTTSGTLALIHWGVIRAQGEEAAKFLHSQLTQDTLQLGSDQARLAGFCSAKGRLLATLLVWKVSEQEVLLALPAELLPETIKRLSMFVMRAKCKLSDASADLQLWGLAGPQAEQWLGDAAPVQLWDRRERGAASVIRLPDSASNSATDASSASRYLLAQAVGAAAPDLPPLTLTDWQWLEVQSGLAWVQQATREQFVPQMLNLELLDGVNFQKGCYPGQEVVARSQYRGSLKRRTFLFELDGLLEPVLLGQEIFHSEDPGQPAGLVASCAQRGSQAVILAETKIAALTTGSLHLGSVAGPVLQQCALPYAFPSASTPET